METPEKAAKSFDLYVTHVQADETSMWLKVWGQRDSNVTSSIEELLSMLKPMLDAGQSRVHAETLDPDLFYCARFTEDLKWYRVCLTNVSEIMSGHVVVRFIDYGNSDVVLLENIRTLNHLLAGYPPQASEYIVAGVLPSCKTGWTRDAIEFSRKSICYEEGLTVRPVDIVDGLPAVRIKIHYPDGQKLSFNRQIVAAGHASKLVQHENGLVYSSPSPTSVGHQAAAVMLSVGGAAGRVFESIKLDWPTSVTAYVVNVVSPNNFYIHVADRRSTFKFDDLQTNIGYYLRDFVKMPSSCFQLMAGDPCLAICREKGRVCRGQVSGVAGDVLKIYFVDFGHLEEKSTREVFPCPPQYLECPVMALRASLDGVTSDSANQSAVVTALRSLDENRLVQCDVIEAQVGGMLYLVRIKLKAGIDLSNLPPVRATYERKELEVGRTARVVVADISGPNDFHVRLAEYEERYNHMLVRLQEFANGSRTTSPPSENWWEEGTALCVQRTEDRRWHRAEAVCRISTEMAMVQLVDIGLSEVAYVSNVLTIPPFLVWNLPALAHRCCLKGFEDIRTSTNDSSERMRTLTESKTFEMHVASVGVSGHANMACVTLTDNSVTPSFYLNLQLSHGMRSWEPESINIAFPELRNVEKVFVTACDSLLVFFGQLDKFPLDEMERFQENLNNYYKVLHPAQNQLPCDDAVVGRFCCTQFSEDGQYYRCRILARDRDNFTIHFVDYGNVERKQVGDLKMLMPEFAKMPRVGIRCRCNDKIIQNINPNAIRYALLDKNAELQIIDRSDDDVFLVSFVRTSSANSEILQFITDESDPPLAKSRISTASPLKYKEIKLEPQEDIKVVYFKGPFQFWGQPMRSAQSLRELVVAIEKYATNSNDAKPLRSPTDDQACLALFPTDEVWYRGLIRSVQLDSAKVEVEFVDYGNVEMLPLSAILSIPATLMELPMQGIECSLSNFPKREYSNTELAKMEAELLEYQFRFKLLGNTKPRSVEFVDDRGMRIMASFSGTSRLANGVDVSRRNERRVSPQNIDTSGSWRRDDGNRASSRGDTRETSRDNWRQPRNTRVNATHDNDEVNGNRNRRGNEFQQRQFNGRAEEDEEEDGWGREAVSSVKVALEAAATSPTPKEFLEVPSASLIGRFRDIFVCSVVSPSEFYCNVTEHGPELKQLCTQLQSNFAKVDQSSRLAQSDVRTGTPCCAKFSEDGSWYRAVIESVAGGGSSAVVRYVDYGSEEKVSASDLLRLKAEHFVLPAQALKCSMHDARPLTGDSWTMKEKETFEARVLEKPLLAQFVERRADLTYEVQLVDVAQLSNLSINKELVTEGQARPLLTNSSLYRETVASKMKSPFAQPVIESGVVEKIRAVWVSHPAQIFCHLLRDESALEELEKNINATYSRASAGDLQLSNARPDVACASIYQEAWYRACILEVEKDTVVLFYVDYGNIESVPLRDVRSLKSEFMKLPYQAVKCELRGIRPVGKSWPKIDASRLRKYYGGGSLEATFHAQCDGCFMVDVTRNGTNVAQELVADRLASIGANSRSSVSLRSAIELSFSSVSDPPIQVQQTCQDMNEKVFASYILSPTRFWLQKASDEATITKLLSDLFEAYDGCEGTNDHEIKVGDRTAAFSADGNWYRAKVTAIGDEDNVVVHFVDYGNTEKVERVNVFPLKLQFHDRQPLAIQCTLPELIDVPVWSEASVSAFREFVHNGESPVEARFLEKRETSHVVSLSDSGKKAEDLVADYLHRELSAATVAATSAAPPSSLSDFKIPSAKWEAVCSFVYSPHRFHLQDATQDYVIVGMTERLLAEHDEHPEPAFAEALAVGDYCVAHYDADDGWYRAVVKSINEETVSLHFVDFGNDETVALGEVRPMRNENWNLPVMSVECRLLGAENLAVATLPFATKRLNQLIEFGEKVLQVETVETENRKLIVRMTVDGICIAEELRKLVAVASPVKPPFRHLVLSEGVELSVNVVHVKSLLQFWVQRATGDDALGRFQQKLCDYYRGAGDVDRQQQEKLLDETERYVGLYAAYADDTWYRCIVFTHRPGFGGTATVQLIDFGNVTVLPTDQLRKLAHEFTEQEAFAAECSLRFVKAAVGVAAVDDNCTEIFKSLVQEPGSNLVDVRIRVHDRVTVGDAYVVDMHIGQTNIQEMLQGRGADVALIADVEQILGCSDFPSGEKIAVCLVHMVSPAEFYLQRHGSGLDWQRQAYLSELLETCEAVAYDPDILFTVGEQCAARLPDEMFYRALILAVNDSGYVVSFIDFGNRDTVTHDNLRRLDKKFIDVPAFCRRCCLAGVVPSSSKDDAADSGSREWSFEAIEVFRELVKDGEGTLLATFLSSEEQLPSEVRLLEMGMDVGAAMVERGYGVLLPDYDSGVLADVPTSDPETYSSFTVKCFDEKIIPGCVCNGTPDKMDVVFDVDDENERNFQIEAGLIDDNASNQSATAKGMSDDGGKAMLELPDDEEFENPSLASSFCDIGTNDDNDFPSDEQPIVAPVVITNLEVLETVDMDEETDLENGEDESGWEDLDESESTETDFSSHSERKYPDLPESNSSCQRLQDSTNVLPVLSESPKIESPDLESTDSEIKLEEQSAEKSKEDEVISGTTDRRDSGSKSPEKSPTLVIAPMFLTLNDAIPVVISSFTSHSEFWVTISSDLAELHCLRKELNTFYKDMRPLSDVPTVATTCVVQDADHGFCRAVILPADDGCSLIHRVDYGDTLPLCEQQIYSIYRRHNSPPRLAIKCSLRLTAAQREELVKVNLDKAFADILSSVGQDVLTMIARERLADGYAVDLLLDNVDVYEFLAFTDISDYESCISSETQLLQAEVATVEDGSSVASEELLEVDDADLGEDIHDLEKDEKESESNSELMSVCHEEEENYLAIRDDQDSASADLLEGVPVEQLFLAENKVQYLAKKKWGVQLSDDEQSLNEDETFQSEEDPDDSCVALIAKSFMTSDDPDDVTSTTYLETTDELLELGEASFASAKAESPYSTIATEGSTPNQRDVCSEGSENSILEGTKESSFLLADQPESTDQQQPQEESEKPEYFELDQSISVRLEKQVRFTHAFHQLVESNIDNEESETSNKSKVVTGSMEVELDKDSQGCVDDRGTLLGVQPVKSESGEPQNVEPGQNLD